MDDNIKNRTMTLFSGECFVGIFDGETFESHPYTLKAPKNTIINISWIDEKTGDTLWVEYQNWWKNRG